MAFRVTALVVAALTALVAGPASAKEAPPEVVRIFGQGAGYGKPHGHSVIAVLKEKKLLEEEFAGENVRFEWTFPQGTGPAINEAIANGQADFANYGGLPNIVGRASGLPTKIVASYGVTNSYLVTGKNVPADSIEDLKGKKIGVAFGTVNHLSFRRYLEKRGLSERDFKVFNLKAADQSSALTSGDIDAAFGSPNLIELALSGVGKITYSSRGEIGPANQFGAFTVTEGFAAKYPETTQRIVASFVKAAAWASDEKNRKELIDIWELNGTPRASLELDSESQDPRSRFSPLLDEFTLAKYETGSAFAIESKFIRQPVDLKTWIDPSFLNKAVKDLGLEGFWKTRRADGTPLS
ncbi:ABC transporter substrate-binding protein [Terrihabitans rhizophilus]|uniref:ABC transporter substrate-binding protein n=1 Tax=Terrihabitans rhizophilus TaxID=3092662 RepID=A0ABU4RQ55_9HYPH|nr:ABC transporter substrate-binding protein [Terrihabitans sp. PJ23]MDX6806957.1 ABC transporter substrate-binding protein [Terrihabitans sp. PJ23]